MNFRFEHPQHLWFLCLIPLFFFLLVWAKKSNATHLAKLGNRKLLLKMFVNYHPRKEKWKNGLFLSALFCFCIAYANPQWGQVQSQNAVQETDILIVFDVSKSMLAQDILPDRLTQAKAFCQKILEKIKAERIGIIAFASNAHLLMPFSSDFAMAKTYIETLDTQTITTQGSSLREALKKAIKVQKESPKRPLLLLLLTDGESHEEIDLGDVKDLAVQNVLFHALGVGSIEGTTIPSMNGNQKDMEGNVILTKLNENLLATLAKNANGSYTNINQNQEKALNEIAENVKNMANIGSKTEHYKILESRFQIFLGFGLLFLTIFIYLKNKPL